MNIRYHKPCQHEILSPVHTRFQSTCPMFPQRPARECLAVQKWVAIFYGKSKRQGKHVVKEKLYTLRAVFSLMIDKIKF